MARRNRSTPSTAAAFGSLFFDRTRLCFGQSTIRNGRRLCVLYIRRSKSQKIFATDCAFGSLSFGNHAMKNIKTLIDCNGPGGILFQEHVNYLFVKPGIIPFL